jgi:hypothetical protein
LQRAAGRDGVPTVPTDVVARALSILVRTCLDTRTDALLGGGAEH